MTRMLVPVSQPRPPGDGEDQEGYEDNEDDGFWTGLSGPTGTFPCPYCTGRRIGKKGELKKWILGKNKRTFQRLVKKHQQFMDPNGGKGNRKDNAARYENCVNMPIRFSRDNDKRALIHQIAPGPLHLMILGTW